MGNDEEPGAKAPQRRPKQTQGDRHFYNLNTQFITLGDWSRSTGIYGHVRRNTHVQTDADKFLLLAALNLVECIAYVGTQLQPK